MVSGPSDDAVESVRTAADDGEDVIESGLAQADELAIHQHAGFGVPGPLHCNESQEKSSVEALILASGAESAADKRGSTRMSADSLQLLLPRPQQRLKIRRLGFLINHRRVHVLEARALQKPLDLQLGKS